MLGVLGCGVMLCTPWFYKAHSPSRYYMNNLLFIYYLLFIKIYLIIYGSFDFFGYLWWKKNYYWFDMSPDEKIE